MAFIPKNISQQDPQWKNEQLGFDNTITIGTDGCALTSLVMLVNGYGFSETPSTLNKKLKDMGPGAGFLGGLIVWGALTQAFPKIVYQRIVLCQDQPAPLGDIDASLNAGQPVIVQIDRSPAPNLQSHWVLLYGKQGNDYLMLDPFPYPTDQAPVTLISRFGFNRPPEQFITAAVWYLAQTPPAPIPLPGGSGFFVQVPLNTTPGLNLRTAPSTEASIVALEGAGTWLLCLETTDAAQAKIGVNGQWLNVKDPQGNTGYVAAWFVQGSGAPTPTPAPAPAPAPSPQPAPSTPVPTPVPQLIVVVSQSTGASGLRLRDQPNLSGNLVVMESVGAQLTVLEPADPAKAKIGVQGQWLNVKDAAGNIGYVAAWYVQQPGEPAPAAAPAPAPAGGTPAAPAPTAAGSLTVTVAYSATPGLRLRAQPNLNADTLTVILPGTRLTVLEPAGSAQPKIGVEDQWLNVKEPGGTSGYVAAWYLQKVG
jgi:hypothetical protein